MIVFVLIVCYPQIFLLQISVRNVNSIVSEENSVMGDDFAKMPYTV